MFVVVVFEESSTVDVIPSVWLKCSTEAFWPPFTSPSAITKAVRHQLEPDRKLWESFKIRVLCACETYEDGRKKAKKAEDTSDVQTEDENQRRKRRRPGWQCQTSDEDDDDSYRPDEASAKRQHSRAKKRLPKAPASPLLESNNGLQCLDATNMETLGQGYISIDGPGGLLSSVTTPRSSSSTNMSARDNIADPDSNDDVDSPGPTLVISGPQIGLSTPSSSSSRNTLNIDTPERTLPIRRPQSGVTTPSSSSSNSMSAFEREMLAAIAANTHAIETMQAEQKLQSRLLQKLLDMRQQENGGDLPDDVMLPVQSVEDLEQLDITLRDKVIKKKMIDHLSTIGGGSLKDNITRVMNNIMVHDVSKRYNWAGKAGWKSIDQVARMAFSSLQISQVVIRAILKNPLLPDVTESQIENALKIWLRQSGDRKGGRKERELKKAALKQAANSSQDN